MWKWIVFLVGSTGIVYLSRRSLNNWRAHGFYRFFAFEAILVLVLLNVDAWFYDPFSVQQIISWVLLVLSIFLAVYGFLLLRQIGKPDPSRYDPTLMGVEKTTRLVKTGLYNHIRHPLYASLLFFSWGVFLKQPTSLGGLLTVVIAIALYATARVEEKENQKQFGSEYTDYLKHTKMFIPLIF